MIELTHDPIDSEAVLKHVANANAGANLLFLGTTRQWTGDVETQQLTYECYNEMAIAELQKLRSEAMKRWDLTDIAIVHRLGEVQVGQASLAVAISSPHRVASFEAGQWLIDTLKKVVPIWKQENSPDGKTEWVHPQDSEEAKS